MIGADCADPCKKPRFQVRAVRVLGPPSNRDAKEMNTPPATRPAAVVTPTLQQLPRLDAILGSKEAHPPPAMPSIIDWSILDCKEAPPPPVMPAIIDWSTAREAPRATPSMDVPRHGTDARRRKYARRRSSDATPSSVMHVLGSGRDQWKTFASSPLMAAAMLIDGEIYDE